MPTGTDPQGVAAQHEESPARPERLTLEARLLRRLLSTLGDPPIEFHLTWSGERIAPAAAPATERVRIADRATLRGLLRDAQIRFGDAYSAGRIEIDGDLVRFVETVYRGLNRRSAGDSIAARVAGWLHRPRRNSLAGSRDNIHRHYDLGNDFYALWLGRTMAYTCAYYPREETTLDEAQTAKMEHVCRKLRIAADDRVIEAGCGWGSLALHIAARHGARVRAFNISREQLDYARHRARAAGLTQRVEFIEDDYRNIRGDAEVFVSVGMLEHVGLDHYPELGRIICRSLTREGRGLIHSIGRNRPGALHPWIERRIFPGAHPPSLAEMMQIFEPWGLSVLDVENLRLHYARTCRHWLARFEAASEEVGAMFSDRSFVRMWRLYLAGSTAAFNAGTLQLFQVLFTKQDNNAIPLTREYQYSR
jgi:cyclopropane-fatty-acyl-phospholipid synthase